MANPTATSAFSPLDVSPEMTRGVRIWEAWTLVGDSSGVGTTVDITPNFVTEVEAVIGPVGYTVTAGVITLTLKVDMASTTFSVLIVGQGNSIAAA